MSVNKVILLGIVGRDPNVRYTGPGQAIAEFPLATTERAHTDADGTPIPERTVVVDMEPGGPPPAP